MQRDRGDHVRFCPIQSRLGQQLCKEHGAPSDASTAVLIEYEHGLVHTESSVVLRLFPWMGFPWTAAGFAGLLVPSTVRDSAYRGFARNRGQIWVWVKERTGMGDTSLAAYRSRVVGLEPPLPKSWGFDENPESDVRRDQ